MNEQFFIVRVWCDRPSGRSRFKYSTACGGWCNTFDQAHPFTTARSARDRLRNRPGSIWTGKEIKESPYYQAELEALKKGAA